MKRPKPRPTYPLRPLSEWKAATREVDPDPAAFKFMAAKEDSLDAFRKRMDGYKAAAKAVPVEAAPIPIRRRKA